MAHIHINEISKNYTYNIGANSFCTVALPITSSWGPGYFPKQFDGERMPDEALESVSWDKFPATQSGLESFVSTYRGPASNYRTIKDFSYYMAVTLLTAGYDVLVCRLCPGAKATATLSATPAQAEELAGTHNLIIQAKYPGTFGNKLRVKLNKVSYASQSYWNLIVYVEDESGVQTSAENLVFAFDLDTAEKYNIPHIDELESKFLTFTVSGSIDDKCTFASTESVSLEGGSDTPLAVSEDSKGKTKTLLEVGQAYANIRYNDDSTSVYMSKIKDGSAIKDAVGFAYKQWLYYSAIQVYDLLSDRLAYNPNRIISPGWDDQDISEIDPSYESKSSDVYLVSPLHAKLMEIGNTSRCATALLDVPKSLPRSRVYSTDEPEGYAQKLSHSLDGYNTEDGSITASHGALFAPWGQYKYVGTSKQFPASPSFLALLIQRAMLLNQPLQYEWALPSSRQHNVTVGKLDYTVPKKYLDMWQTTEGVGVNVITDIPDLGTTLWGNSTLYNVPPATYQALANLSTRYLVNAVKDIIYKTGIGITFNYNNNEAYSKFYAGVTPLLDTMKQVGAIDDYYVKMSGDIEGLDQVNANSVIGKVYLIVNGVINNIDVDLIALPPGTDLTQFQ